jgi:hypothetical protein
MTTPLTPWNGTLLSATCSNESIAILFGSAWSFGYLLDWSHMLEPSLGVEHDVVERLVKRAGARTFKVLELALVCWRMPRVRWEDALVTTPLNMTVHIYSPPLSLLLLQPF